MHEMPTPLLSTPLQFLVRRLKLIIPRCKHFLSKGHWYFTRIMLRLSTALSRGECSKMPRVSKMPTPLKTYCKLHICILVVSLHVATSREPSCAVMFRNSRYFRDYSIFSIFDYLGLTMHLRICPIFSLAVCTTNMRF